jgi:hypothetical protein
MANQLTDPPAEAFKPNEWDRRAPRWQKGQSGNPAGRPRGSRNKLATAFFDHLYAAWEEQGEGVIARAMFHDPAKVLAIVAQLMPHKIEVTTPTEGMSDERLEQLIELAERMAALRAESATGGTVIEGECRVAEEGGGGPGALGPSGGGNRVLPHPETTASTEPPVHRGDVAHEGPSLPDGKIATVGERLMARVDGQVIVTWAPGPGEEDVDPASLF